MDPWTTLCWVYATVEESVRPSHQSTATTVASGFAERPASRRYRSTAAGAALQAPALSSKCGQRHAESRRRRLNTNLFCQQIDMVTSACEILYDNALYKFTLHYITLRGRLATEVEKQYRMNKNTDECASVWAFWSLTSIKSIGLRGNFRILRPKWSLFATYDLRKLSAESQRGRMMFTCMKRAYI